MKKGIIGKKLGMTQIFDEIGNDGQSTSHDHIDRIFELDGFGWIFDFFDFFAWFGLCFCFFFCSLLALLIGVPYSSDGLQNLADINAHEAKDELDESSNLGKLIYTIEPRSA